MPARLLRSPVSALNSDSPNAQRRARPGNRWTPRTSLQRNVGNRAVVHLYGLGVLQPRLSINHPHDKYEREADRVAEAVMRVPSLAAPEISIAAAPAIYRACAACASGQGLCPECEEEGTLQRTPITATDTLSLALQTRIQTLRAGGQPLPASERSFFEPRIGYDFSSVRVHTGAPAAEAARGVNARAFTIGRNVVFGSGEYAPQTEQGRRLLAHELTHVVQQQRRGSQTVLQRDLLAHDDDHFQFLPSMGGSMGVPTPPQYLRIEGNAAEVESALSSLISAGEVGVRRHGNEMYFFADRAVRSAAQSALRGAGFSDASEMADALVAKHDTYLYTGERLIQQRVLFGLWEQTLSRETDLVQRQQRRPLTAFERREAEMVFGDSLDLEHFELVEESLPVMSIGGYARSIPGAVYFPAGSFGGGRFMPWLIHELTHQWQYQHGVSVATTLRYAIEGNYDYGGEQGLITAHDAGHSFTSFNTEQQGDILQDFYERTKAGDNVSAWLPFVQEVRSQ